VDAAWQEEGGRNPVCNVAVAVVAVAVAVVDEAP
jgi:hypothetical protein